MLLGCYDPQPPAGAPCGNNGACPDEQLCDRGTCVIQPDAATDPSDAAGGSDAAHDATVTPPDAPSNSCQPPFVASTHGCHAFFPQGGTMTWDTARDFCVSLGGDLPTITTVGEAGYVGMKGVSASAASRIWVGLRRASNTAPWLLVNTTPATYFNWDVGEPNEGFLCAASKDDGLWGDRTCASMYDVVCER